MSEEKFTNEPRAISLTDRVFTANGKKYYIADKISIDRWKEYEKLVPRITYGIDFKEMQKSLKTIYSALNEKRFADAAVITHNLMSSVKDANDESRVPPGLMMCTLVMNREGEDVGVYDPQVALDKINDWRVEGLDILSFFAWALNSITGFRETYLLYIEGQAQELVQKTDLLKKVE